MPLHIVRNDITKMNTEAIVNTAGSTVNVGEGCDSAIYAAAGYEQLHALREQIGSVPAGEAFITPGFNLQAKYIIHAVSPLYIDGESGEEEKLRACYRNSLALASEHQIQSIAFPLIATGSFGYPMADGLQIAKEEIEKFLLDHEMDVTIVVFGEKATGAASMLYPSLKEYISDHYVRQRQEEEYGKKSGWKFPWLGRRKDKEAEPAMERRMPSVSAPSENNTFERVELPKYSAPAPSSRPTPMVGSSAPKYDHADMQVSASRNDWVETTKAYCESIPEPVKAEEIELYDTLADFDTSALEKRLKHIADPFGSHVLYLAEQKGLKGADVQNRAWITKQVWHKLKKNAETYHPDKVTALRLCVALDLNMDETRDLLARAGYAFSSSSMADIIWQFGIENRLDILDISDLLEEYELPAIVNF